ncbi:MAG: hypothetical protein R2856_38825 [Caldilineaceae bacterium]
MQSPTGAASADGVFVLWPAELFDQVNPCEVANTVTSASSLPWRASTA